MKKTDRFTGSLSMILVIFMISGCATHKNVTRYITHNPEILADFVDTTRRVEYRDSIAYRDTTINYTIIGDTSRQDTAVKKAVGLLSGTVRAETEFASARAWIKDKKLHIELIQHEQVLQLKIDSAVVNNVRTEIIYETKWLPSKPYVPKKYIFYKNGFFVTAGLLLLLLLFLVLKR